MTRLLLIVIIFFSYYSVAQNNQSSDTLNITEKTIKEVVVTGQIEEINLQNSIHRIRVIDKKTISSGIYQNLADIMQNELNITKFEDNVLGSGISIQGVSGRNVKILIDNVPVIGRLNGNIDLSQISINNIERIEIVEGPLSTIYGSDALAGTINLISKKNPTNQNVFNSFYETVGRYNLDALISNRFNQNHASFSFGRKYFNGWNDNQEFNFLPISQLADTNRVKEWKPKEQIFNKVTYVINKNNFEINNYFENFYEKITNLGKPKEPYYENAFDEYYYTLRTNLGSNISFNNKDDKVKIMLAYNKYKREKETYYTDLTTLEKTLLINSSAQDTSEFDLIIGKITMSNNQNSKFKYQTGVDLQKQTAKGKRILNNYQAQNNYAFFSFFEYNPNQFISLRPALRIIYNSNYKAPVIPSFNILSKIKNQNLRLSYARGFRAPDFKELFLYFVDINHNIVGNPLLKSEESNNIQISLSGNEKINNFQFRYDLNLFQNLISNKIDLAQSSEESDQYSYFNISEYKTKGLSSSIDIYYKKLNANLGISYIGRYNNISNEYSIEEYNYALDYNFRLVFNITKNSRFNIFYKNTGEISTYLVEDDNISEKISDSYNILDVSVNQQILNEKITLTVGAKNLFNIKTINRNINSGAAHSSSNNTMSVGYGTSFFTSLNLRL